MIYGDYVSISASSSGVTGTINLPIGARLLGLDLNWNDADGIPTIVELYANGLPQPLRFCPNIAGQVQTGNSAATGMANSPLIDLRPFGISSQQSTITIKVTSTAAATVVVGLTWEAN